MLNYLKNTKFGKTILATTAALTLYSSQANANENLETRVEDFDQAITPLDIIVETTLAYGLKIFWHELGHYSTARMMGYESSIHGSGTINGDFHLAYTEIRWDGHRDLPRSHDFLFSSAGIGFTTIGNTLLTNYLVNTDNDNSFRPFLGALSFVMMIDRYTYVTNSAVWHFSGQEAVNGDDVYSLIKSTGINEDVGYALLLAGTITEAVLRWQEISYLYQTLIGNNPEYEQSGIIFSFVPGEDSVSFQFTSRLSS